MPVCHVCYLRCGMMHLDDSIAMRPKRLTGHDIATLALQIAQLRYHRAALC